MPGLPEIEIIRRDLEKEVVGRRVKDAQVRPGSNAMKIIPRHGRRKEFQDLLEGAKIDSVERSGKTLLLTLDNDHITMIRLADAGQLIKTSASGDLASHTHIVISFTIGGQLRVLDPKLTSEVWVASRDEVSKELDRHDFMIDPFAAPLAWQHFSAILEERKKPMKELMADERFVVGLGNLYSDEILFAAGLRYDRPSHKLSSQDVRRLYRSLMEVLQDAVKARGTSYGEHPFVDLTGNPGTFQLELKVYEREGEFCRRCRNDIQRVTFNSTETYFCPQCQS